MYPRFNFQWNFIIAYFRLLNVKSYPEILGVILPKEEGNKRFYDTDSHNDQIDLVNLCIEHGPFVDKDFNSEAYYSQNLKQ